jgi:Uma2 family endonuclease
MALTATLPTTKESAPITTVAALLALPKDDVDRYLIGGKLREKPITKRNRWHSHVESRLVYFLWNWLHLQPQPRGCIYSGEAGCILRRDPDTTVGIDIVYVSAKVAALESEATTLLEGVPILAVEVLSPSDTEEDVNEKVDEYLTVGVAQVWLVDTRFRTVQVFRPGAAPQLFSEQGELIGDPDLPGFRVSVADLFSK